jgi:hypothetical protein
MLLAHLADRTLAHRTRNRAPSPPPDEPAVAAAPEAQEEPNLSSPVIDAHGNDFITRNVLRMDSAPEIRRMGKQYIHVSALIGMCARLHLLSFLSGAEHSRKVQSSMRLVWALGRAAEKHVRTQFIEAVNYVGVIGKWSCLCEHTKHDGQHNPKLRCEKCGKKVNNYGESGLLDHDARVVGSPDLIYVRETGRLRVVEIKSICKKDYDLLTRPLADHVAQGMSYRRILERSGRAVDDEITVLYVCKDYQWKGPYKEFYVPATAHTEHTLDIMWAEAERVAEGIRASEEMPPSQVPLPPRLSACANRETKMAAACPLRDLCFSRQ